MRTVSLIVPRSAWATRTVRRTPLPVRPATGVVVHHAVSALEGSTVDTDNDGLSDSFERLLREIEYFHIDTRGWPGGIAYSIVVGHRAGRKAEGRGWGLQSGATGDPDDRHTLSVCALGNYEGVHDATDELVTNIAEVIAEGITAGELVPLDQLRIYPHQDKPFPTACCGRNLIARLPEVRPLVAAILEEEDPVDVLEFIEKGHTRPDAEAQAVAMLARLGYKPGARGENLGRALSAYKAKRFPGGTENDEVLRGPVFRALIADSTNACPSCPEPAIVERPDPTVVAELAEANRIIAGVRSLVS
jgi:hypothetical protein